MGQGLPTWGQENYGPQTSYHPSWGTTFAHEQPMAPHNYGTHVIYSGDLAPGMTMYNTQHQAHVPHVPSATQLPMQTVTDLYLQNPLLPEPGAPMNNTPVSTKDDSDGNASDASDMELEYEYVNEDGDIDDKSSNSKINIYKDCHKMLGEEFGDHFYTKTKNLPYYKNPQGEDSKNYFKTPSSIPLLKIDPDLEGSWFDPKDKENPSDRTTYWKSSTPFPSKSRITPKEYPLKAPPRNPYIHVENENLRLLLEAPVFKSISLDHSAFNVSSIDVTNNPHTTLDALIRNSMMDNFTVDEYLKLLFEIIPKLSLTSASQADKSQLLALAMEVFIMVAECNQRSGQAQLAAYVSNKLALRDVVLDKFSSQNTSRDILRGSSFLSHNLFGPLPESFSESLKSSTNRELRFTRKPFTSSFSKSSRSFTNTSARSYRSTKRPANFTTPYSKRFKGKWGGNRVPFSKQQFFRGKNQKKR